MQKFEGFRKYRHEEICIYIDQNEDSAVKNALSHLSEDLECVLDGKIMPGKDPESADIVIWTAPGKDSKLCGFEKTLRDDEGSFYKEAYHIEVCKGTIYICGSDRRGSVYGIYELSRILGVSPWYYWADVPRREKEMFALKEGFEISDRPGIPYRGIFINDEEELESWVRHQGIEKTIGPATYSKVFELLLRLKGNIMWPAMHVNAFNHDPENARLADEMGIIIGTSHCDILMRNNNCEWDGWVKDKGYDDIRYDYSIEGTNRERLKEYWSESVNDNKGYEVCYTLGMRGIHDSEFETSEIDKKHLSEKESLESKKKLLEQIIKDQQNILFEQGVNEDVMQIFVPYKEVLTLYDAQLDVPENVTLMWVDDNFGYMRRFPNQAEKKRTGGNGLYYHGSYWGHPNMSYLFLNSIPLAHTEHELHKAYEQGIQKIWIYNCGAIKPLELDIDFFMFTAWNMGKKEYEPDSFSYLKEFFDFTFSIQDGAEIADIMTQWSQITNMCKLEHLRDDVFSQTDVIDIAAVRVHRLENLMKRACEIYERILEEERDAFFQLVLFKIQASYLMNSVFYYADRSRLSIKQGKFAAADHYCASATERSKQMKSLIDYCNHKLSSGKWNRLITPFEYPPPSLPSIYDCMSTTLSLGVPDRRWSSKASAEGRINVMRSDCSMDGRITFRKSGTAVKCLEIFPVEYNACERFRIEHSRSIGVSCAEGQVETEKRIGVWITDPKELSGDEYVRVYDGDDALVAEYSVGYEKRHIDEAASFHEADGVVTIEADKLDGRGWRHIPKMGRGYGGILEFDADTSDKKELLEFTFDVSHAGEYVVEILRFPSLNMCEQIFLSMYVDDIPIKITSVSTDEWRGTWKDNVLGDVESLMAKIALTSPGIHRIRIEDASLYFAFSGINIYRQNSVPLRGLTLGSYFLEERFDIPEVSDDRLFWYDTAASGGGSEDNSAGKELVSVLEYQEREMDLVKQVFKTRRMPALKKMPKQIDWAELRGEIKEPYFEDDGIICIRAIDALSGSSFCFAGPDEKTFSYALSGDPCDERYFLYVKDTENCGIRGELSYKVSIEKEGKYTIALYANVFEGAADPVRVYVDDEKIPEKSISGNGRIWTFAGLKEFQIIELAVVDLTAGEHTVGFSVKSCIRIKDIIISKK